MGGMVAYRALEVVMWIVGLWLLASASASDITEFFPDNPVDLAEVQKTLTPERLGPVARTYDASTATAEVDRDRRVLALAKEVEVADLRVSRALSRYADVALALYQQGVPDRAHEWFVAEHVGLAQAPRNVGTFVAGTEDGAAEMTAALISGIEDGLPVAVATRDVDEGRGMAGIVVALDDPLTFDPFPRVVEPGATVRIPGTLLDARQSYALAVQGEGTKVERYPIEGEGTFDLEFEMPRTPGIYRVAMTAYEKDRMPEQPFFFSMYVGTEPPDGLVLPDFGSDRDLAPRDFERDVWKAVNEGRKRYGLRPLRMVGDPETMRTLLAELPDNERAAVRYLSKALERDPLPTEPHGIWRSCFRGGHHSAAATAWAWLSHPWSREILLNPDFDRIILGSMRRSTYWQSVFVSIEPAGSASLRDEAHAQLAKRWPADEPPKKAPKLQAMLDAVAKKVATGKLKQKKVGKEIEAIFASDVVSGGASSYFTIVPPGKKLDTGSMNLMPSAKYLGVGYASGDLGEGRGFTYSVLAMIAAGEAK